MAISAAKMTGQRLAAVYQPFQGGKLYEQGLLIVWFLITFLPLQGAAFSALRYLLVLYYLSFLVVDARNTIGTFARSFWLLPVQVLAVLSVFWSPLPSEAMRSVMLNVTSAMIIIIIASQFTPKQIARCMMITAMIASLFVLISPVPLIYGGPYASKNNLAMHMLMGYMLCLAFSMDKTEDVLIRMAALPFAAMMAFFIVQADSTTALLFMLATTMVILFGRLIFIDLSRIQNIKTLLFLMGVAAFLAIIYAALAFLDQALLDKFLGMFGKDSTLTGRTALWDAAANEIRQRPWLGLGMEGFWYYDSGVAQTLNENDNKDYGTKLTFHNSYLEVAVHLGYVGLTLFIISLAWVVLQILIKMFRSPDMMVVAYSVLVLVGIITTFTESVLWGPFDAQTTLFFVAGAAYAGRERKKLVGHLVVTEKPAQQAPA
jgi:exopolysaccharide production protein ExoQ